MPFSEYFDKLPLPIDSALRESSGAAGCHHLWSDRERRESGVDTGDLLSMLLLAQDEEKHAVE